YPNMNAQLQKSCIQLSGLDGRLQGISQIMLRNIQQNTKDPKITKQLERNMRESGIKFLVLVEEVINELCDSSDLFIAEEIDFGFIELFDCAKVIVDEV
ncbi:6968_t:CDS:2, partial [Racocetra fulgida]